MKIIYLDGKYLKISEPIAKTFTPGTFKAKGVFETMLGVDGVVMDAALHLDRMRKGLKALGIRPPAIDPSVLRQVLRRNHFSLSRVRMMVWQEARDVHVMIGAWPYHVPKNNDRACLIKTNRTANARLADVKSLDYSLFAESYAQAIARGYGEALLLNAKGHIFEASRANVFWIKDKILYTPPLSSGCLNGITRRQVIEQAQKLKVCVKEKNLTPAALQEADAAFLTNSLIGIKSLNFTEIKIA